MKYSSTRGLSKPLSFEQALFSGLASDGGLVVPESIPAVSPPTLKSWSSLSYRDLAKAVIPLFIDESEIPRNDLLALIDSSFRQGFAKPEVVSMVRLKDDLNVLEMFYGPSLAFKDLALSFISRLFEYFLSRSRQRCIAIVGTSGDTGSAAIQAVKGHELTDIIVLLPRGRCTRLQELQMTTAIGDNVHVFRVDGTNDDLEKPISSCFADSDFVSKHRLCSINSINWTRILVQTVHYFYAYLKASHTAPPGEC